MYAVSKPITNKDQEIRFLGEYEKGYYGISISNHCHGRDQKCEISLPQHYDSKKTIINITTSNFYIKSVKRIKKNGKSKEKNINSSLIRNSTLNKHNPSSLNTCDYFNMSSKANNKEYHNSYKTPQHTRKSIQEYCKTSKVSRAKSKSSILRSNSAAKRQISYEPSLIGKERNSNLFLWNLIVENERKIKMFEKSLNRSIKQRNKDTNKAKDKIKLSDIQTQPCNIENLNRMGSALSLSARNKSNEYIYKEECQILLPNKQKMSHKNIFKIPSLHKFHKTIESNDILTMQNKLHSINKAEVLRDKSFKLVDRIQFRRSPSRQNKRINLKRIKLALSGKRKISPDKINNQRSKSNPKEILIPSNNNNINIRIKSRIGDKLSNKSNQHNICSIIKKRI